MAAIWAHAAVWPGRIPGGTRDERFWCRAAAIAVGASARTSLTVWLWPLSIAHVWSSPGTSAVSSFATLARLLDPGLDEVPARDAAERCPDLLQAFLARIDLACSLRDFGISQEELTALAKQSMVFPSYQNAPRVPTPNEMLELIGDSY
jgi:alcohol dehydrogenase class IV